MLQVVGITFVNEALTFVNEALIRGMAFFVMGLQESDVSQTLWAMIKAKCKKSLKARHRETEYRLVFPSISRIAWRPSRRKAAS